MTDPTRFILVQPSHAGNVGAVARALRVMGFADLVLVAPRRADLARDPAARARASGAQDVLERARTVATLAEALEGVTHLCATAMTPRDFGPPTRTPRDHLASLAAAARAGSERIGFLFGPERTGLANEDVYRCDVCLSIPTAPDYGSLNLGQAVQLLAYEWRQALGGFELAAPGPPPPRADAAAVQALLAHWRDALVAVGFLDPATPKKLIPRLNGIANRLALAPEEVHLLRGIARAMQRTAERANCASRASRGDDPPR